MLQILHSMLIAVAARLSVAENPEQLQCHNVIRTVTFAKQEPNNKRKLHSIAQKRTAKTCIHTFNISCDMPSKTLLQYESRGDTGHSWCQSLPESKLKARDFHGQESAMSDSSSQRSVLSSISAESPARLSLSCTTSE